MSDIRIRTNKELIQTVNEAIRESGITKTALAGKIGLSRQGLDKMLQKQSFSLDDANKILNILHKSAIVQINE